MEEHPGYSKSAIEGNNTGNSRKGYGKKRSKAILANMKSQCRAIEMGIFCLN